MPKNNADINYFINNFKYEYHINRITLADINTRMDQKVITGYKYSTEINTNGKDRINKQQWTTKPIPITKYVKDCIGAWRYAGEQLHVIQNDLYDNINYNIKTYDDVVH